jgi:uncharacterized membrane protein
VVEEIYIAWAVSALAIAALAALLGFAVTPGRGIFGILIDHRGRYSLTHFQIVMWTIVVLSLISGVFWGRLVAGLDDPLEFSIPDEVLGLLGISLGSTVAATAVKSAKDATEPNRIAASNALDPPRPAQLFLLEEGVNADKVIDVSKFQNFIITVVLVVAYVALAIEAIDQAGSAEALTALPTFSGTFLVLLGISHGAYVIGKLPAQAGDAPGITVATRSATTAPPNFTPRNSAV